MNKTGQLIEVFLSFPPEYVKNLRKMLKLKKVIKSYLTNLIDYEKTYSEDIVLSKTKHDKNKHLHFHFFVIKTYKKYKKNDEKSNT